MTQKLVILSFLFISLLSFAVVQPIFSVTSVNAGITVLADSAVSTNQDQALAFIEKALPVDISKYNTTLTKYSKMNGTADIAQYILESDESTLVVNCYVKNNVLTGCNMETKKGQVISDRPYANLTDAARGFLEKYQTYTGLDSTEMISMLADIDTTKNSSITIGNTKLTISNQVVFGDEITLLSWAYTVNGADYTSIKVGFRNGIFDAFYDNRGIYSIGDTSVNISKEQAINSAMEYVKTYSYAMYGGVRISGFNVTEDRTVAELRTTARSSTVLKPYWSVMLYLNQAYPGSVNAFLVNVWADSGKVFNIGHEGPGGGSALADNSGLAFTSSTPEEISSSSTWPDMRVAFGIAIAVIAVVVASSVIIKKKRK